MTTPFWRARRLHEMSAQEWESLCDGCGQCCLHKIEDEDTGEVALTDVACALLDIASCRCTDYAHRRERVPGCVRVTPQNAGALAWMPATCAYRLLAEGQDLMWWHPLVSGDPETVHLAGISVRGRAVAEADAGDLEDHVRAWPEADPRSGGDGRRNPTATPPAGD